MIARRDSPSIESIRAIRHVHQRAGRPVLGRRASVVAGEGVIRRRLRQGGQRGAKRRAFRMRGLLLGQMQSAQLHPVGSQAGAPLARLTTTWVKVRVKVRVRVRVRVRARVRVKIRVRAGVRVRVRDRVRVKVRVRA